MNNICYATCTTAGREYFPPRSVERGGVEILMPVWIRERRDRMPASSENGFTTSGDIRPLKSTSELGVTGKESLPDDCGRKDGRVGKTNGRGDSSTTSRGKVGDVGEAPGVLRRT